MLRNLRWKELKSDGVGICFALVISINLNLNAMNKILNYSAIKQYRLPSRKNAFKYADTFIAIIFLMILIMQLIS